MRGLNGVYTKRFDRACDRVGHVFQGRYKANLVAEGAVLGGTRPLPRAEPGASAHGAGAGGVAVEQLWSNGRGSVPAGHWLDTRWILAAFGATEAEAVAP